MIIAWMFYCSVCALGLSLAAALAERSLLAGRGAVRLVWIGAVALSLLVPAAAFVWTPRDVAVDAPARVSADVVSGANFESTFTGPAPITRTPQQRDWRATLARLDAPFALVWVTLSLALAVNLFGGMITLAWMRRRWERRSVLGVDVYVSARTGPAVVGAVSTSIVLPEWVLSLQQPQLALLLRHEEEHRRAGDGQLLAAAQLALVAMPWNLPLWWQFMRLRVAVELDCDARVLQNADARMYGDLLLEVARPRSGLSLLGAAAFAERATQLDRRIRVLGRHRVRTSRAARAVAAIISVVAVTAAWVAPRPPVPVRAADAPGAPELLTPSAPSVSSADIPGSIATENTPTSSVVDAIVSRDTDAVSAPVVSTKSDSIFAVLFAGIRLTGNEETRARALLAQLAQQQKEQEVIALATFRANRLKIFTLQAQRDSALRALLTTDADRALFDELLARAAAGGRAIIGGSGVLMRAGRGGGGARGGGAGAVVDTTARAGQRIALRDSGSGSGARGRVAAAVVDTTARVSGRGGFGGGGRGGGSPTGSYDVTGSLRYDTLTFDFAGSVHRLFEGITLTPDQEARALMLIVETQRAMRALELPTACTATTLQTRRNNDRVELRAIQECAPQLPVLLRLDPATGLVSMQAESASALLALVSNAADRATLQSRIVIETQ